MDELDVSQKMKTLAILALACCLISCGNVSTGKYGDSYMPIANGFKPTKSVAIYVSRSEEQKMDLARKFAPLIKNQGWKMVGSVRVYGPTYYTDDIKNLGMSKGADTALIHIGRTQKVRRQVSYGYGYPSGPNYYQVSPFIQPYQVAPPQGNLLQGMADYEDARRRWSEQDRVRTIQDAEWTQEIIFLRSPNTP